MLGVGRVVCAGAGAGIGGGASAAEGSSGSSASSSATGMMKPKSISPTLCLLKLVSIGGFQDKGQSVYLPSPAHAVSHALLSYMV